jgi:ParB family chromosome partitioning protein
MSESTLTGSTAEASTAQSEASASQPIVVKLRLEQLRPSVHQSRKDYNEAKLQALAESMKHEGQLQPILVRKATSSQVLAPSQDVSGERSLELGADSYELVIGERRWRAAKLLGWETIEAKVITTVSEAEAAAKSLVENTQRERLNPVEEAEGFADLNRLDPKYWNQDKIAEVFGKTQGYISESLSLLGLAGDIQENIRRRIISRSHGIEIAKLSNPEQQMQVQEAVITRKLNRDQTRKFISEIQQNQVEGQSAKAHRPAGSELVWKGDELHIKRPFRPKQETAEAYMGWLSEAIQKALQESLERP